MRSMVVSSILFVLVTNIWRELWFWFNISHILCFVTGASVHAPRQSNSAYIQTVRRYINQTRRPEHPHSPTLRYKQRPQVPPFSDLLHGILPGNGPTIRYGYVHVYRYVYNPVHLHRRYSHHEHCTAASRDHKMSHHLSDASPSLASEFLLVTVFDWIIITILDLIRLNWGFDWIRLKRGFGFTVIRRLFRFDSTHV